MEIPFDQPACISGFRVFGIGAGEKPLVPEFRVARTGDLDMVVEIESQKEDAAIGYNILWGTSPYKLYHSYMMFHSEQRIGALVKGKEYYVRVDAFNEAGIVEGSIKKVPVSGAACGTAWE